VFASQALYSIQTLGLDQDRVNVDGGSIAIGYPSGRSECSFFRCFESFLIYYVVAGHGARQIATGLNIANLNSMAQRSL
jgi:hypothetical protein